MDFRTTTVLELAQRVRTKAVSAEELTRAALENIDALNPTVNAFVAVDHERAIEQAKAVDQVIATGGDPGPLAGIPFGVKDNMDTAGYRTTHGSALHLDDAPSVRDAVMVARMRAAGGVVVGKTNLPEFAWSANTDNTTFGPTRNPWDLARSSGGSSGGSAAALASGMVPLATGSDGGGSIRIPSACTGLSGMKPSLGRVPTGRATGPEWLDLSTMGPMARRLSDIASVLDIVVGPDPADLRSLPRPEANWSAALENPKLPTKVAWSKDLGYAPVDPEVLSVCVRALEVMESLGAEIIEVGPVFDTDPVAEWLTLVAVCVRRTLEPLQDRWGEIDPLLRFIIESADSTSAVAFVRALDASHAMNHRLVELFHDCRLLVTPTTAAPAPPLDLKGSGMIDGQLDPNWVRLTYPFNMTRSPAATVCAGLTSTGIPVGMQFVGPQHADLVVLRSAAALEAALGFDDLAPVGC